MVAAPDEAVFHAIADLTRRRMLDLCQREMPATRLVEHFDISQPAVSQHLRILREAGLVRVRREGRQRIYSTDPLALKPIFDWIEHYRAFWNERLDALGELLDPAPGNAPSTRRSPSRARSRS